MFLTNLPLLNGKGTVFAGADSPCPGGTGRLTGVEVEEARLRPRCDAAAAGATMPAVRGRLRPVLPAGAGR